MSTVITKSHQRWKQYFILISAPFFNHLFAWYTYWDDAFYISLKETNVSLKIEANFSISPKWLSMSCSVNFPFALWAVIDLCLQSSIKVNRFLNASSRSQCNEKLIKRKKTYWASELNMWFSHLTVTLMYPALVIHMNKRQPVLFSVTVESYIVREPMKINFS